MEGLIHHKLPIRSTVKGLLRLEDEYGSKILIEALKRALKYEAYGLDYVQNILCQTQKPKNEHSPVKLRNPELNSIQLDQPSLADYDADILKKRKTDESNN